MDSFTACKKIGNPKLGLLIQEGNYFEGCEAEALKKWCELSRYVIDIYQLFDVYRWNCGQLSLVPMNTDGRLQNLNASRALKDVRIILNAITMNAVSSGVNLVRTMEAVASSLEKEPWSVKDNFHAEVTEIIDTNLAYSLMDELRNYASHGQLIVSVYSEVDGSLRAAFDVEQLRSPIFIQQKPRVQEQLSSVADALNDIEDGPAYLSYCLCMDSFFEAIARLYRKWLQRYRPLIERITGEASDLYRKNSENIRCYSNGLVFSVVMEGAEAHLIEGRPEDTLCLYLGMLDAAQEYIEQTATNLKETSSHFTNPLAD